MNLLKQRARNRSERRVLLAGLGGVMAGTMLSNKAVAGVLEPPGGSPSPTGVVLDAVAGRSSRTDVGCANPGIPVESLQPGPAHLYAINQPGYYVLTRNLFVPAGMGGIAILSSDVYLDLWGFHVIEAGGGAASSGIYCDGENITINDGDLRGFGIAVDMEHASRSVLWDVDATGPTTRGMVLGSFSECCDCNVHNSPGGTGFELRGQRTLLHECMATGCSVGFATAPPPIASSNLVINNVAMACTTPFSLASGAAFGPIANCVGLGDISPSVEGRHPLCNMIV